MHRFGLIRPDGLPRIAVLCGEHARFAINKCCEQTLHYWLRSYDGDAECEACYISDHSHSAAG